MSLEVDSYSWHPFQSTDWCSTLHRHNGPLPFHAPCLWLLLVLFTYQKDTMSYKYAALPRTFSLLLGIPKPAPFQALNFILNLAVILIPTLLLLLPFLNFTSLSESFLQNEISLLEPGNVWFCGLKWILPHVEAGKNKGCGDKPDGLDSCYVILSMLPNPSIPQFPPKKKKWEQYFSCED